MKELKKDKINFLKIELENELKKDWRKFVTTSEILEIIIMIIKNRDFKLNDFDIYINENEIKIHFRRKDFMNFIYLQNPVNKIIKVKSGNKMKTFEEIKEKKINQILEEAKEKKYLYLDNFSEEKIFFDFCNELEKNNIKIEEQKNDYDEEYDFVDYINEIHSVFEKEKDFYCSIEAEYVIYVKEEIAKKNYYNSLLILHDLNFEDGCKASYFIDDNYNLCFGLLKTINYGIPKYYEKEELENLKSKYNNSFNDNKFYDIFYDYNENSVINIKKDLVFEEIKNYLENGYKNEEVIASEKIAKKIIENKENKEKFFQKIKEGKINYNDFLFAFDNNFEFDEGTVEVIFHNLIKESNIINKRVFYENFLEIDEFDIELELEKEEEKFKRNIELIAKIGNRYFMFNVEKNDSEIDADYYSPYIEEVFNYKE